MSSASLKQCDRYDYTAHMSQMSSAVSACVFHTFASFSVFHCNHTKMFQSHYKAVWVHTGVPVGYFLFSTRPKVMRTMRVVPVGYFLLPD